jgi:hypothetical protein
MSSSGTGGDPGRRTAGEAAEKTAAAGDVAGETASRALALASALSEALGEITRRLSEYSAFGRRSRQVIIALAVSFALDIVLTVALGLTALSAHGTANANDHLVQALHASQLTSCASGNVFRADQDTIWRDFISLIAKPSPGETAAQAARTARLAAQFLAYIATVNHPVNCTALYGR